MSRTIYPALLLALLGCPGFAPLDAQILVCADTVYVPAESCELACINCVFTGTYSGSNSGYTPSSGAQICAQISLHNDLWLAFVAGESEALITVQTSNCQNGDGLQMALLEDCAQDALFCNPGQGGGGALPMQLQVQLEPGRLYRILLDGWTGDVCDFTLTIDPPSAVVAPPALNVALSGPDTVCPYLPTPFLLTTSGPGYFTWTGPAGSTVDGWQVPITLFSEAGTQPVILQVGDDGTPLCVRPASCNTDSVACPSVTVLPAPQVQLAPLAICAEETPYLLPDSQSVTTSGLYAWTRPAAGFCDTVFKQAITVRPALTTELGALNICPGECVDVCGESFCDPGSHIASCTSFNGCDSLVGFTLYHDVRAVIEGVPTFDCTHTTLEFSAAPTAGAIEWLDSAGTVLSTLPILTVSQAGVYVLRVTGPQGCVATDTLDEFFESFDPPVVAGSVSNPLSCDTPFAALSPVPLQTGIFYSWISPSGEQQNLPEVLAYETGAWQLTAIGSNSCSATVSVEVTSIVPEFEISGTTPVCVGDLIMLFAAGGDSFVWTGPGGIISQTSTALIGPATLPDAGIYSVFMSDSESGCTAVLTILVEVIDSSEVQFSLPDSLCLSTGELLLAAVPPGGVFSGPGVNGPFFIPGQAGLGEHLITYAPPVGVACTTPGSTIITVADCTVATQAPAAGAAGWTVFPNPNAGTAVVRYSGVEPLQQVTFTLLDAAGRRLWRRDREQIAPGGTVPLELGGLAAGVYWLGVMADGEFWRVGVVVE